jgi:hypothetical protein
MQSWMLNFLKAFRLAMYIIPGFFLKIVEVSHSAHAQYTGNEQFPSTCIASGLSKRPLSVAHLKYSPFQRIVSHLV